VTGQVPNYYPWLYHALLALAAHFSLGGRALGALDPVFFTQVLGGIVALFALGRELSRWWLGGAATALFGGLAGGLGFVVSKGPAVVLNPRADGGAAAGRFLGDMLFVRSYNISFNNLAPAFPRDLGFALLPGFLLLLVVGFTRARLSALVGAGVVVGLVGLTTGESMFYALVMCLMVGLAPPSLGRLKASAALLLPALSLWSIWVGPLLYNYVKYRGFFGMGNSLVRLTPGWLVGCWGISIPFAVFGALHLFPRARREPGARIMLVSLLASVALLVCAVVIPETFGHSFATLGYQHRYWPLVHLSVVLYAGAGATFMMRKLLAPRKVALGLGAAALTALLSLPSPVLASVALPSAKPAPRSVTAALEGRRDAMLQLLDPSPGLSCIAAVPPQWSHPVWSFTGYRLVLYRWTSHITNLSPHIRWRDVYHYIPSVRQRLRALRILLAPGDPRRWQEEAARWNVDVVVIPSSKVSRWMRSRYRVERTNFQGRPAVIAWLSNCGERAGVEHDSAPSHPGRLTARRSYDHDGRGSWGRRARRALG
jgi:hypothetical protein